MRYSLMEAENGQILIVDNSTFTGKALVSEGCKYIGTIDSDYSVGDLLAGFNKDSELTIRELQGTFRKIRDLI